MVRFVQGNLLESKAQALVNAVNTVGVMGKGLALGFKPRFPKNFSQYEAACRAGEVKVGQMFTTMIDGPRWLINFPTKQHWRNPTRLEWIVSGLADLNRLLSEKNIQSVAIPALGCGNGGLSWSTVRPLIEEAFSNTEIDVQVYEPLEAANSKSSTP